VRIVVSFAPAGSSDIVARLMGQWLSERFGQPFVIENRPGGGGNIGTEAVVRASPDGHTLLVVGGWNAINATHDKLSFNFIRDIAPVTGINREPYVIVVHLSVSAKQFPSSSPLRRPIRARSPWRRAGSELPPMCRANCSR
jgi:tripartite-type tricarboxylate transporter receptor subunit TctC